MQHAQLPRSKHHSVDWELLLSKQGTHREVQGHLKWTRGCVFFSFSFPWMAWAGCCSCQQLIAPWREAVGGKERVVSKVYIIVCCPPSPPLPGQSSQGRMGSACTTNYLGRAGQECLRGKETMHTAQVQTRQMEESLCRAEGADFF